MSLIVTHNHQQPTLGQQSLLTLGRQSSFAELIFWLLSERQPTQGELTVFELILNLSIDHGADTPSAQATIKLAQAGQPIGQAIAAGLEKINNRHGGAQEQCLPLLYRLVKEGVGAEEVVSQHLAQNLRLPGFGHRLYKTEDPRAELVISAMQEQALGPEYILAIRLLGQELVRQSNKQLPLNIDGAIAVALAAFNWPTHLATAVFIIARVPGLCAHFLNSRT